MKYFSCRKVLDMWYNLKKIMEDFKVKELFIRINANIKMLLGICNGKGCLNKSTIELYIPIIDTKRCVCEKHFQEFKKVNSEINVHINIKK